MVFLSSIWYILTILVSDLLAWNLLAVPSKQSTRRRAVVTELALFGIVGGMISAD